MTTNPDDDTTRRLSFLRPAGWTAAGLLLLTPLVAMQFTEAVDWSAGDFLFMGLLIGAVGVGLEIAVRASRNVAYRLAAATALGLLFLLVWINAAVGVIGEDEGANLLYGAVLATTLVGAVLARLRAGGLARTMVATACAQVAVPVAARVLGLASTAQVVSREVVGLTVAFAALWLVSAALFRKAADASR